MTKCIRLYNLTDIEFAESETHIWYVRFFKFNGYGVCWSKWHSIGKLLQFKRIKRQYENYCQNDIYTKNVIELQFEYRWCNDTRFLDIEINNKCLLKNKKYFSYRLPN